MLLLAVAIAVGSYLVGHATYGMGLIIDRWIPLWRSDRFDARRVFASRVAGLSGPAALGAHYSILQAAAELHDKEAANEIVRMRAIGLMLRNSTIPILLALIACAGEVLVGQPGPIPAVCALFLSVTAVGTIWRSHMLRFWAHLRTLEICFLIPELDLLIKQKDDHPNAAAQSH